MNFNNKFELDEFEEKLRFVLSIYGDCASKKLESEAKRNYKWTPRTGRAHQSLFGSTNWENDKKLRISLSHGVEYGTSLEFAHEKRYAIVKPTIDKNKKEIIQGLQGILK